MPAAQTFSLPDGYRHRPHCMPWWLGYLQLLPLRRLLHDPHRLLGDLVQAGDTVVEVGPGMGYFTLALAEMVGADGQVVAVDCQARMLDRLVRRARARGLTSRVHPRHCPAHTLACNDLDGTVDTVLAFNVVHESPDPERLVGEMARALRPGGRLYLSEPRGHVSGEVFLWEYGLAREAGLRAERWPRVARQMTVVMQKPA